jgi:hypothetical protein
MKTKNLFFAISLALIITGMFAVTAMSDNLPEPPVQAGNDITYVVNINHSVNPDGFTGDYIVVITDGRGRAVVTPKYFHMGQWTYTFKEHGDVKGTRVARMVKDPNVIIPGSYIFTVDVKTGTFYGGKTYVFTLEPVPFKADIATPAY